MRRPAFLEACLQDGGFGGRRSATHPAPLRAATLTLQPGSPPCWLLTEHPSLPHAHLHLRDCFPTAQTRQQHLREFPGAVLANDHKPACLKQGTFTISQSGGPEPEIGNAGPCSLQRLRGGAFLASSSSRWLPVSLGLWPGHPNPGLGPHVFCGPPCLFQLPPLSYKDLCHWIEAPSG